MEQVDFSCKGPDAGAYLSLGRTWDGARPQPVLGSCSGRASPHIPTPHPQSLGERGRRGRGEGKGEKRCKEKKGEKERGEEGEVEGEMRRREERRGGKRGRGGGGRGKERGGEKGEGEKRRERDDKRERGGTAINKT